MTTLIHILGSDIPHHNQTVLRFFNDVLSQRLPAQHCRQFMVVSRDAALAQAYPQLVVRVWPDKRSLARAVIAQAKQDKACRFFLHGNYNTALWLALLSGRLPGARTFWHIWGADLYEESRQLRFRLFYPLRRLAQAKLRHVFGTCGDIHFFHQRQPAVPTSLLYFPTRLNPLPTATSPARSPDQPFTVLIGNSGDPTNRHLAALQAVYDRFGRTVNVVLPMGYPANNQRWIETVRGRANALFGAERVELLTRQLSFDDYLTMLQRCDLGYFLFQRQQGIGTLCLLIQLGIPFVISRQNPFGQDLRAQHIPVWYEDDAFTPAQLRSAAEKLKRIDLQTIAFFPPRYCADWVQAIQQAAGD